MCQAFRFMENTLLGEMFVEELEDGIVYLHSFFFGSVKNMKKWDAAKDLWHNP